MFDMLDGPMIRKLISRNPPKDLTPAEYEWYIQKKLIQKQPVKLIDIAEFQIIWLGINNNSEQGMIIRDCIKQGCANDKAQFHSPIVTNFRTKRRAVEENFNAENEGDQPLLVKLRYLI